MLGALRAACDEMGAVLVRSAHSANIKERRDASTALFDERGRMVMQAEHIPVHLGAMPSAVAAVLDERHEPGLAWILNDPYRGGTHLPDITVIAPLFSRNGSAGAPIRVGRSRSRQPGPPRRRRRARARQHARRLAFARGRGRRDLPHAARRAHPARARGPHAQPAPARGRPARPARRRARRGRAGRGADRAVRARQLPRRARGDARLRRAPHPRAHRRAPGRGVRARPTCWRRPRGTSSCGSRRAWMATRSRSTSRAPPSSTAATSTARSPSPCLPATSPCAS